MSWISALMSERRRPPDLHQPGEMPRLPRRYRAAHAGGGTWISSPTAAIATASRRYIWSRIGCPGPELGELRTHSGAYSSLRATLTGARYANCYPVGVIPA
jgi:hypothetical protein